MYLKNFYRVKIINKIKFNIVCLCVWLRKT